MKQLVLQVAEATEVSARPDVCDMRRECERGRRAETHIDIFRNHEILPFAILYKKYCTQPVGAFRV